MYFPYLKLRQMEAFAIRDTICGYSDNKVIPIIEPYCERDAELYSYNNLIKAINSLLYANKKFILIIDNETDLRDLKSRFLNFNKYCIRGYYSDNPALLKNTGNYEIAILHRDTNFTVPDANNILYHIMMPSVLTFATYISRYPVNKVVKVENAFVKHSPNNMYPQVDTFRAESVFTFKNDGYAGFGDFTILEQGYEVSKGADADSVTHVIHLTRKQDANRKLEVRHYLTTPEEEPDNRRRSTLTIRKAYNERHMFFYSLGIRMIVAKNGHSTNSAYYKRIGIVHHIELIHSLI